MELGVRKSLAGWDGSRRPGFEPLIEGIEGPASEDILIVRICVYLYCHLMWVGVGACVVAVWVEKSKVASTLVTHVVQGCASP